MARAALCCGGWEVETQPAIAIVRRRAPKRSALWKGEKLEAGAISGISGDSQFLVFDFRLEAVTSSSAVFNRF
jgi:hypothetical protein